MNGIHSIEEIKNTNPKYIGEIKIKTEIVENNLEIKIFDNGKGISEKNQDNIFSAGFTTKKKGQETCLGLAICKKIIEKHNGKISFEWGLLKDELSYRTVFKISIPLI